MNRSEICPTMAAMGSMIIDKCIGPILDDIGTVYDGRDEWGGRFLVDKETGEIIGSNYTAGMSGLSTNILWKPSALRQTFKSKI